MQADSAPRLILVFGGPAAGKGTQASRLSGALGYPHISSGDLLRDHQRRGEQVVMERGDLLPDEVVSEVVFKRLAQPDAAAGAVLDGYPRTLSQAQALDRWVHDRHGRIGAAFFLEVPQEQLIERAVSRGEAGQRTDDHADIARRRVDVFLHELPTVLEHYASQGLLHRIDGTGSVDDVHGQILEMLGRGNIHNPATDAKL